MNTYLVIMRNTNNELYVSYTMAPDEVSAKKNVTSQWPKSKWEKTVPCNQIGVIPSKKFCNCCNQAVPNDPIIKNWMNDYFYPAIPVK